MSDEKRHFYKTKIYEVFRERIFAEDLQINNRTYLTIIIQIGFIACWLLSDRFDTGYDVQQLRLFMALSQLLAALFSLTSVLAAMREIRTNKQRYKERYADVLDDQYVPLIIGGSKFHLAGHLLSVLTQLVFLAIGGFFLYQSLR